MKFIDSDLLLKEINEEIRDSIAEEDKECFRYIASIIKKAPAAGVIPIKWMQKAVVEMIYDNEKVTEEDRSIVSKIISRWERQNESNAGD